MKRLPPPPATTHLCDASALWALGWAEGRGNRPRDWCRGPSRGWVGWGRGTSPLLRVCEGTCHPVLAVGVGGRGVGGGERRELWGSLKDGLPHGPPRGKQQYWHRTWNPIKSSHCWEQKPPTEPLKNPGRTFFLTIFLSIPINFNSRSCFVLLLWWIFHLTFISQSFFFVTVHAFVSQEWRVLTATNRPADEDNKFHPCASYWRGNPPSSEKTRAQILGWGGDK